MHISRIISFFGRAMVSQPVCSSKGYSKIFRSVIGAKNFEAFPLTALPSVIFGNQPKKGKKCDLLCR